VALGLVVGLVLDQQTGLGVAQNLRALGARPPRARLLRVHLGGLDGDVAGERPPQHLLHLHVVQVGLVELGDALVLHEVLLVLGVVVAGPRLVLLAGLVVLRGGLQAPVLLEVAREVADLGVDGDALGLHELGLVALEALNVAVDLARYVLLLGVALRVSEPLQRALHLAGLEADGSPRGCLSLVVEDEVLVVGVLQPLQVLRLRPNDLLAGRNAHAATVLVLREVTSALVQLVLGVAH